jgi:RHS repeat-associated protein
VTSVAVNGATVLNNVTYEPLGPVNGWTWGNGTTTTRTYDTDGKVAQITSAGTKTYDYDDAFRIRGITDTSAGTFNWTYGYDALDRLTGGTSPSVTRGWTYDANGNRLTETGSSPSTYSISPTSHRISGITGALARTYGYDAAGNTTSYAAITATYNNAGRLQTLAQGGTTETVVYNALGQRIEKTGGSGGTVLYWYDEAGHLLGEYDGSGNLIQETVWLGDIPVATLRPNNSGVDIFYVHTDQLNTPHQITRPSDNPQMWTWFSDPFGTDAANANPAGLGTFTYNLRLPGQVFDGQAGLHYNWHRDFDPATGRYLQSDPLGVAVSNNTYSYVDADPLDYVDPFGLAKCTYSISEHRMICVSNDGSKETVVGPEGLWSGMGKCTNNSSNSCVASQERGPIPPGQYRMNKDTRPEHAGRNFWRLEPMPKVPGWKWDFRSEWVPDADSNFIPARCHSVVSPLTKLIRS